MRFEKGNKSGKGRPKGFKNKKTLLLENFVEVIVKEGMNKFRKELNTLTGKDYVQAYTTFLEYHKPKLSRSTVNLAGNVHISEEPIVYE